MKLIPGFEMQPTPRILSLYFGLATRMTGRSTAKTEKYFTSKLARNCQLAHACLVANGWHADRRLSMMLLRWFTSFCLCSRPPRFYIAASTCPTLPLGSSDSWLVHSDHGNTRFWRNDLFYQLSHPASGNKTFVSFHPVNKPFLSCDMDQAEGHDYSSARTDKNSS